MSDEQRILCPSCHCNLLQPEDGPFGDAFIYATRRQMRERNLTCDNLSCPIYIENQPHLHDWVSEDEREPIEDQLPQLASRAEFDDSKNHQLITANIDGDSPTTALVTNHAVPDYHGLQHSEIDGGSAFYSKSVFQPISEPMFPFIINSPFTASPGPFPRASPNAVTGQGYGVFPGPTGTGLPATVPVYSPVHAPETTLPDESPSTSPGTGLPATVPVYSPVHAPETTLPDESPSTSPGPASTASPPGGGDATQGQKPRPRASTRNRYTEHEVKVIMRMKAQGCGNDTIAQALPRHTARSIEAKYAVLTKGRPRS